MSHSIIPPSSAYIWGKPGGCTGWVLMAQQYPETEDSESAIEGEASHEVGGNLIGLAARGRSDFGGIRAEAVGTVATNGVIISDEMFEGAELYANDVAGVMRGLRNFDPQVEKRVYAKRVHPLSEGTPDCWLYDRRTHTLYIWDYKFGYLVVEAFENWQAINYYSGIVDALGFNGIDDQNLAIKIRIVQPRAHHKDGPVREWATTGGALRGYVNILEGNAAKALGPNAELQTGDHCLNCQARHACAPYLKAALGLFEAAAAPLPVELSPEAIGVQLSIVRRAVKRLEKLDEAFKEQATGLLRAGKFVPGWTLEEGIGVLKWNQNVEAVINLGKMLGYPLEKPGVITPTQAKKLGIDDAVIMAYSEKPKTGLKLVPQASDFARKVFQS